MPAFSTLGSYHHGLRYACFTDWRNSLTSCPHTSWVNPGHGAAPLHPRSYRGKGKPLTELPSKGPAYKLHAAARLSFARRYIEWKRAVHVRGWAEGALKWAAILQNHPLTRSGVRRRETGPAHASYLAPGGSRRLPDDDDRSRRLWPWRPGCWGLWPGNGEVFVAALRSDEAAPAPPFLPAEERCKWRRAGRARSLRREAVAWEGL